MLRSRLQANGLLLLAAVIWGFSFVAQRVGMEHIGPFAFNTARFALGALVLLPIVLRRGIKLPRADKGFYRGFSLAGLFLFLGITFQQIGIVYTTAGKAGFITGLYVVFVPLLGLFLRQKASWLIWLAVFLATTGMYFLCVKETLVLEQGDFFVLVGAFFWACHVHVVAWVSPRFDSYWLAMLQFAMVALLSATCSFILETTTLSSLKQVALPILYTGILSVGVAFTIQIVAQKVALPSHVAIILSMEAAFAALGGWMILSETLSLRGLAGCALMFSGMLVSQLGPESE